VRGPLNVARPPQGHPIVFQAGSSEPGRELAARTADVIFTAQPTIALAKAFRSDILERAGRYGRDPDHIKILPGLHAIVGRTESEALDVREQMRALIPEALAITQLMQHSGGVDLRQYPLDGPLPNLPPSNSAKARQALLVERARREHLSLIEVARISAESAGHLVMCGSPRQIAEEMAQWLAEGACDGFAVTHAYYPTPVEWFVQLVIPELQRLGVFRTEYEGRTLRENLGLPVRGRSPAAAAVVDSN
jgi:alkanesulfonate monooxygenase SsuD/methylene tetrahydromethanopterin reductase-like flavin-dependent oxidoreductase (luciferase family)